MSDGRILLLSGGVGGSKLADGLAQVLPPERLTIVVNTGDDFTHLGLRICPDIDTVSYMMGDLVDESKGWGRRAETWRCLEAIGELGGPDWFRLGDQDLALHLVRTELLRQGRSLNDVTVELTARMGIKHQVAPMTESIVETRVRTHEGEDLAFQDYFVRHMAKPVISAVEYRGVEAAVPSVPLMKAIESDDLAGVVIAPSNPILSIGPILSLPGIRKAISARKCPVVAVSPLIGGAAVKGPAAKLLGELGFRKGNQGIAEYYKDFLTGIVIHSLDEGPDGRDGLDILVKAGNTRMDTAFDRKSVAKLTLEFLDELKS